MRDLYFLKLGGSLITDKTAPETIRIEVIKRIAGEIREALNLRSDLMLLLGHGSGSFGHVAAARHQTNVSVRTVEQWRGFVEVSDAAARLNQIVRDALLEAGVSVLSLQPSASSLAVEGEIVQMASYLITRALDKALVPLVYGDVSFDKILGGTIISTEKIFSYLAKELKPSHILLAGEAPGVLDRRGKVIALINRANIDDFREDLGGSEGTDVTGGMASKVEGMLDLVEGEPKCTVYIFSGLVEGNIKRILTGEPLEECTRISSAASS